jgi:ADP-ribose pyrophosphatase YjhB (NUDIX family)
VWGTPGGRFPSAGWLKSLALPLGSGVTFAILRRDSVQQELLSVEVGVNVAILRDGRVLLTKRKDFGVWCLPGGHVDTGESVAQAAIRGAAEETGLDVRLNRLVGIYSIPKARAWVNLIVLFAAEATGGALKAQQAEVLEMRYFHPDEIPGTLLWGHRQRIQDALAG